MIHLHLLLGIVVVGHHVNLWNDVVGQLMGKLVDGLYLALGENLTVLLLEVGHGCGTCTAGALVRRDMDTADVAELLDGLQHYDHHDGCTVRIGNNALGANQSIFGIYLRNNQRN